MKTRVATDAYIRVDITESWTRRSPEVLRAEARLFVEAVRNHRDLDGFRATPVLISARTEIAKAKANS